VFIEACRDGAENALFMVGFGLIAALSTTRSISNGSISWDFSISKRKEGKAVLSFFDSFPDASIMVLVANNDIVSFSCVGLLLVCSHWLRMEGNESSWKHRIR